MTDESTNTDGVQPAATSVNVATLKLPTFWPSDPELWFAQVEAQFATRGIIKHLTKLVHMVASLPPEFAAEVRDLVVNRPKSSPYDELRTELTKRTSPSESKKLQQLISAEELGERKPSQLLRHMRQLLGEKPPLVGDNLLTHLFVNRLPANIRVVLASSIDSMPLDKIAQLADKMLEASGQSSVHEDNIGPASMSVATQPVPSLASEVNVLRQEVSNLNSVLQKLQVDGLQSAPARSSRYRRGSRLRSHGGKVSQPGADAFSAAGQTPVWCWYHATYGQEARRCNQPCSWRSGNCQGNQ